MLTENAFQEGTSKPTSNNDVKHLSTLYLVDCHIPHFNLPTTTLGLLDLICKGHITFNRLNLLQY